MSEIISSDDYFSEINEIAEHVIEELELTSPDDDLTDAYQYIWEMVDGHQWVGFYAFNTTVLAHSPNDSAYFEEFGPLEATSSNEAISKMAFAAMHRDVTEKVSEYLEEMKLEV